MLDERLPYKLSLSIGWVYFHHIITPDTLPYPDRSRENTQACFLCCLETWFKAHSCKHVQSFYLCAWKYIRKYTYFVRTLYIIYVCACLCACVCVCMWKCCVCRCVYVSVFRDREYLERDRDGQGKQRPGVSCFQALRQWSHLAELDQNRFYLATLRVCNSGHLDFWPFG